MRAGGGAQAKCRLEAELQEVQAKCRAQADELRAASALRPQLKQATARAREGDEAKEKLATVQQELAVSHGALARIHQQVKEGHHRAARFEADLATLDARAHQGLGSALAAAAVASSAMAVADLRAARANEDSAAASDSIVSALQALFAGLLQPFGASPTRSPAKSSAYACCARASLQACERACTSRVHVANAARRRERRALRELGSTGHDGHTMQC